MGTDRTLIKKMFYGLLITNAISMAINILCVVIDAIVTGRFLGPDAVTAAGLVQPVLMLLNTIGMFLGPGLGVVCTRFMGKAEPERIDQVFSITMYVTLAVNALLAAAMYIFAPSIALALGGKAGDTVVAMTSDYLRGFSFGVLPMRIGMSLTGVMMLDNDRNRAMTAAVLTFIGDVSLDLANVLVFRGGMYGMALASSGSYLISMICLLMHFRRKNRILHFTFSGLRTSDIREVMICGIPNVITMGGQALRGFCFNAVLLSIAGGSAVAALSVCNSAFSLFISVLVGIFVSVSILSSMFFGEEDRSSLAQLLGISMRTTYILMSAVMLAVIILAKPLAMMFLKSDSEAILAQAAVFIRLSALQLLLMSGSYSLTGMYQGIKKLRLNYLISLLRDCILPVLFSCLLGKALGMEGFEAGFIISGALVLVSCYAIPAFVNKRLSFSSEDLLLLDDDFGAKPEERFEVTVHTKEDAMDASVKIMDFCRERGADGNDALRYSLFAEEIACNTVDHGFRDISNGSLDIKMVYSDNKKRIRFRDNGRHFDPAEWLKRNHPEDPLKGAGIRIVVGMAEEVRYIPAMGLNNLLVIL